MYTNDDRNNLRIFKYHQKLSEQMNNRGEDLSKRLDKRILESEKLLNKLGYNPSFVRNNPPINTFNNLNIRSYDEILSDSSKDFDSNYICSFEDILSQEEIEDVNKRIDDIDKLFINKTKMNRTDIYILLLATALQTIKWILLPAIGEPFDPSDRMEHNDPEIEKEHKETLNETRNKHYSKDGNPTGTYWEPKKDENHQKSWIEILYTKAPYDKIKGSSTLDIGLSGKNHRLKTLGHDPILGWIFGTANFMTDTATLVSFDSYRIKDAHWVNEPVSLVQLFSEVIELTRFDWRCLCAALVAQGAHLASDKYTKMGLPIPILSTFNEEWASKLYTEHYDYLCLQRDLKTIAMSASISILINMIISFIHSMFYSPIKDGIDKDLYEVRTRKILLLSNFLATSSNIIFCCIMKNPHKLDIGGILVTLSRLFLDIRFITKIKDEFIQMELDKDLNRELDYLNNFGGQVIY